MSKQTEAERLADELEEPIPGYPAPTKLEADAAADYCKRCNAPHAPAIKVLVRCGLCSVINGKLPPTKFIEKAKETK